MREAIKIRNAWSIPISHQFTLHLTAKIYEQITYVHINLRFNFRSFLF